MSVAAAGVSCNLDGVDFLARNAPRSEDQRIAAKLLGGHPLKPETFAIQYELNPGELNDGNCWYHPQRQAFLIGGRVWISRNRVKSSHQESASHGDLSTYC